MLTKLIIAVWVVIILIAVAYLYHPKTKDVLRFEALIEQELPVGSSMKQIEQFVVEHNLHCGDPLPYLEEILSYTCRTQLPDVRYQTFIYFNVNREGALVGAEVRDGMPRL